MKKTVLMVALIAAPASAFADELALDSDALGNLEARSIGPAAMSGRVAAIDAVQGEKLTLWVGGASGGVWKSVDGGITWKATFDKHTQSIGAVAIDSTNPETVWVGTGESWLRNSVSVGDGIYKTTDGGDSWQRVGLPDSERVARIQIDPRKHDTVYVCATGHAWNANAERGVFRTTDGGRTWQKVLYVDDNTGCADLEIDSHDPSTLWAAMWQYRRTPWSFTSGGAGSGLYKTTDGGAHWRQVRAGLPDGQLGRIALAAANSKAGVIYAYVESRRTGVFRSADGGEHWTEANTGPSLAARPFYFGRMVVDPGNENRIYKPSLFLSVSEDGGKTFAAASGSFHGDVHAVWVNPRDSAQVWIGTDGGVYGSTDRANHWRFVGGLPLSQFYHVSVDDETPFHVYGGLQDNGSWMAPSRRSGGIGNRHWQNVGIGDGFWTFPDPVDKDVVYSEYQGGKLLRVNKKTLETKQIEPFARAGEAKYRFNWNTPIHLSPTRPGVMYVGAQFLLRSADRGDTWTRISPDLTTNDASKLQQEESGGLSVDNSSAENHCTIFAISESPKNANVIWVGTDDGNVQVSRDGGKSWTNVVANVPGLPKATWVSHVEASRFDPAAALATFDGHATGDMTTYVYRTTDYGKTWQPLATPELHGYAHVIKEDTVDRDLLFLGTERGLWISLDGGKHWAEFKGGGDGKFPPVAVRDLVIHPSTGDLVLATHGRGIWIVDDISSLRKLTPAVLAQDFAFLDTRPSVLSIPAQEQGFEGDEGYDGQSPPEAAVFTYYLKKRHIFGDLTIEILDKTGKVLTSFPGGKRRGINRVTWPMRLPPPKLPPAATEVQSIYSFLGPRVPDGTYTVRIKKGDKTYTTPLKIVQDPRSTHSAADRALQQKTVHELYGMLNDLTYLVDALADLKAQAADRSAHAKDARKSTDDLAAALEALRSKLVATREVGFISGEEQLRERLGECYGGVNGYDGRPTESQLHRKDVLKKELADAATELDGIVKAHLEAVNAALARDKLPPITKLSRDDWQNKQTN
ncbi:MAG TPA: hypothetical protein VF516_33505 [Kofleriaceae bacterium]